MQARLIMYLTIRRLSPKEFNWLGTYGSKKSVLVLDVGSDVTSNVLVTAKNHPSLMSKNCREITTNRSVTLEHRAVTVRDNKEYRYFGVQDKIQQC